MMLMLNQVKEKQAQEVATKLFVNSLNDYVDFPIVLVFVTYIHNYNICKVFSISYTN